MSSIKNLPESRVVRIWQCQLPRRTDLVTEEGEPITVVYPGRLNDGRGADLLDAVIDTSKGRVRGDVEVHVKSSHWRAHRHHQDPIYNRVILHVVFWQDDETATTLQNGGRVPTLSLNRYLDSPDGQHADAVYSPVSLSLPCRKAIGRSNTESIGEFLDDAGDKRFLDKASGFSAAMNQIGASQCLYQGIMGALGYARNKLPFLELARRVPLHVLESIAQSEICDTECLAHEQALLLGTSGLLPSQSSGLLRDNDEWIEVLETAWPSLFQPAAMSEADWHMFKVRPSNLPTRRITAMSYLLLRYRERGILQAAVEGVKAASVSMDCRVLDRLFAVSAEGYWARRLDFGLPSQRIAPALLGSSRASGVVVNIILPFIFAWGRLNSQPELAQKSLDIYRHYPKLATNIIERHMIHQFGLGTGLASSARRQQGLIHIYKTMCSQGECQCCPMCEHNTKGIASPGGTVRRMTAAVTSTPRPA